jgi:hypothetical protein
MTAANKGTVSFQSHKNPDFLVLQTDMVCTEIYKSINFTWHRHIRKLSYHFIFPFIFIQTSPPRHASRLHSFSTTGVWLFPYATWKFNET